MPERIAPRAADLVAARSEPPARRRHRRDRVPAVSPQPPPISRRRCRGCHRALPTFRGVPSTHSRRGKLCLSRKRLARAARKAPAARSSVGEVVAWRPSAETRLAASWCDGRRIRESRTRYPRSAATRCRCASGSRTPRRECSKRQDRPAETATRFEPPLRPARRRRTPYRRRGSDQNTRCRLPFSHRLTKGPGSAAVQSPRSLRRTIRRRGLDRVSSPSLNPRTAFPSESPREARRTSPCPGNAVRPARDRLFGMQRGSHLSPGR